MTDEREQFLERLMSVFKQETADHLHTIAALLREIQESGLEQSHATAIERLHLTVHSLKGAARSVERRDIESLCQEAELKLIRLKKDEVAVSSKVVATLRELVDYLDLAVIHPTSQNVSGDLHRLQVLLRSL